MNHTIEELETILQAPVEYSFQDIIKLIENYYWYQFQYCVNIPYKKLELQNFCNEMFYQFEDLFNNNNDEVEDEVNENKEGFTKQAKIDNSTNQWYTNEYLSQTNDENQKNKITDRKHKIQLFDQESYPMKQEQIAVTDTYSVPVKQDSLNPTLKNVFQRFINLDSQFRPSYTLSTDYTCLLSDRINNILSISIHSYQIPYSWYIFDSINYGNTCFWVQINDGDNIIENITISVPSGSYDIIKCVDYLNNSFVNNNIINNNNNPIVSYNQTNAKITIYLNGSIYNSSIILTSNNCKIIFFDPLFVLQCNNNSCNSPTYLNTSLGWMLGYRSSYVILNENGNIAESIVNINGTKYLILCIDDFNQNQVNNGLISIQPPNNTILSKSDKYPILSFQCIPPEPILNPLIDANTSNGSNSIDFDYTYTIQNIATNPKYFTNSQLYSKNSNLSQSNNLTQYFLRAATSSDVIAILPIKTSSNMNLGSLLVENSGSLQDNKRTYFGPVSIDRLHIRLLDDHGFNLNLNGSDWSITLLIECLYQF